MYKYAIGLKGLRKMLEKCGVPGFLERQFAKSVCGGLLVHSAGTDFWRKAFFKMPLIFLEGVMKKLLKAGIASFLIAVSGMAFAGGGKESEKPLIQDGVLKIGMEVGYPPFEYFDKDGKTPIGFDVELGKAVAEKLGLKPEFIDTAWDGIFAGVDTKKYDCIMSAVTITEERKAKYGFAGPYIGNGQSIVILKDSTLGIKSPEDCKGLRVGYQAETTSDIFMTKKAEGGLKFEACEYDKVMNAFDDLRLGRCDAVCADSLVSVDYVAKEDSPFVIVWQGVPDEFFGVCLKKDNAELQKMLSKAIAELFKEGKIKEISMKIFNMDMVSNIQ